LFFRKISKNIRSSRMIRSGAEGQGSNTNKISLSYKLQENLDYIRKQLGHSPDITIRQLDTGESSISVAVVYTDGIVDKDIVNDFILKSLQSKNNTKDKDFFTMIKTNALAVGEISTIEDWDAVILSVLSGDTILLIDGYKEALSCGTRGGNQRSVTEPSTQVVIRGPKDGFTESIGTNVALVRRRIKSPHLWLETMNIGKVTKTDVGVMYINGIVNDDVLQEVKNRLNSIEIDSILESGYIEELIEDDTKSFFPTIFNTERPDTVAGSLLEGRIAIFVDGTPFVLIAPVSFFMFFQAAEDYYQSFEIATAIRLLRYAAFIISLFGPSVYIAAITYHQEMIPTALLISLAAQREAVPFPAYIEAMLMEVSFEILREAGIRMPRAIGQAVSIIGALVLGQAAVEAGIVSSMMVIVVAITGISSFCMPSFAMALSIRLIRFIMMLSAAFLGFYGMAILSIVIIAHMCGLRSFGIPYMIPLSPFNLEDQKDTFIRLPWKSFFSRPRLVSQKNTTRMDSSDANSKEGSE
jgi:spore germination protein KA